MSRSETYVTASSKLRDRHRAGTAQKSRCSDEVEQDTRRGTRTADGTSRTGTVGPSAVQGGAGRRSRQRTAGRQRKSRQQLPEVISSPSRLVDNDDDDDAGSVCSGASSASENSVGSGRGTRRPRGIRRPTRTSRCAGDGDPAAETDRSCNASPPVDSYRDPTVASAIDKTVPSSCCGAERPEPEGGVHAAPYKSMMSDEFERLIYGPSEPLFSDSEDFTTGKLGDEVDITKDCATTITTSVRPSQQRRRFADPPVNVDESTESLFHGAQMLSSNNMMKFAIIQMELKNVKDVSLRRVRRTSFNFSSQNCLKEMLCLRLLYCVVQFADVQGVPESI